MKEKLQGNFMHQLCGVAKNFVHQLCGEAFATPVATAGDAAEASCALCAALSVEYADACE